MFKVPWNYSIWYNMKKAFIKF